MPQSIKDGSRSEGPGTDLDEARLLERARDGDGDAFSALVTPYRDRLIAMCDRITTNRADSEDALQLTLLAAWQHLGRFEGRSGFSTWLYRIAYNAAIGIVRRNLPEPVALLSVGDDAPGPEGRVTDREVVRWALRRIPVDYRAAIVLREIGSLSYEEIALTQGIPIDTVKSRIFRARAALRLLLAEGGSTDAPPEQDP